MSLLEMVGVGRAVVAQCGGFCRAVSLVAHDEAQRKRLTAIQAALVDSRRLNHQVRISVLNSDPHTVRAIVLRVRLTRHGGNTGAVVVCPNQRRGGQGNGLGTVLSDGQTAYLVRSDQYVATGNCGVGRAVEFPWRWHLCRRRPGSAH